MLPMPDDWPTLEELGLLNGYVCVTSQGVKVRGLDEGIEPVRYRGGLEAALRWRWKQERRRDSEMRQMEALRLKLNALGLEIERVARELGIE